MTPEQYKEKYGDERIMGVPKKAIDGLQGEGFTHREDIKQDENGDTVLGRIIFDNLMSKLRCEAECDPSFK